MWVYIIRCYLI